MWPDTKMKLITIVFLVLLYFSETNCFLDRSSSNTRNNQLRTSDRGVERLKDFESRRVNERRLDSRETFRNLDDRESIDRNNNIVRWQRISSDRSSRSNLGCPKPTLTDNVATTQWRNEGRPERLSNRLISENTYGLEQPIQRRNRRDIQQNDSHTIRRQILESRGDRIDGSRSSSRNYRRFSEKETASVSRIDAKGRSLRSSRNRNAFNRPDERNHERSVREIDSNRIQRRTESRSDVNERFRASEATGESRRNRVRTTSSSTVTDRRLSQNDDNFNAQRFNERRQITNDRELDSVSTLRRNSRNSRNSERLEERNTQTIERILESKTDRRGIDRRSAERRSSSNSDRSYERRQKRDAVEIDTNSIQRRIAEFRLSRSLERSSNSDERSSQAKNKDLTGSVRRERETTSTIRAPESRLNQVERRTSFPVIRSDSTLNSRHRDLNNVERRENRDSRNIHIDPLRRSVSESEIIQDKRSVRENLREGRSKALDVMLESRRNRIGTTSSSPVTNRRLSNNGNNFNTQRFNERRQIRNDRELDSVSTLRRNSRNSRNSERLEERSTQTIERILESKTDRRGIDRRSAERRSSSNSDRSYERRQKRDAVEIDTNSIQRRIAEFRLSRSLERSSNSDERSSQVKNRDLTGTERRERETTSTIRVSESRMNQVERRTSFPITRRHSTLDNRYRDLNNVERLLQSRTDRQEIDRRLTENRSSSNSARSYERRQKRNAAEIDPNSIQRRIAEFRLSRDERSRNSETFDERSSRVKNRDLTGTERRERTNTNKVPESRINQVERTSFPVTSRQSTLENSYTDLNNVERRENRERRNININLSRRSVSESKTIRDKRSVRGNLEERRNRISNSAGLRTQESRLSETSRNRIRDVNRQAMRNNEERRATPLPTTNDRTTTQALHFSQRTLRSAHNRISTNDESSAERRLEREIRSDRIGDSRSAERSRRTDTVSAQHGLLTQYRRSQNRDATSILRVKRDARNLEDRTHFARTKPKIIRKQSNNLLSSAIQFRNEHMQTKMEQQSSPAERTVLKRQRLNSERNSKPRLSLGKEREDRLRIEFVNNGNSIGKRSLSGRSLLNHIATFENDKSRGSVGSTSKIFFSGKPDYENLPNWLSMAKVIFLSISIVQILYAGDPKLFRNKFLNIFTLRKEKVH